MTSLPEKVVIKHITKFKELLPGSGLLPPLSIFKSLNFPEGITDNSQCGIIYFTPSLPSTSPPPHRQLLKFFYFSYFLLSTVLLFVFFPFH